MVIILGVPIFRIFTVITVDSMTSYVILVTVSHLKMLWGEVGKRNKLLAV